MRSEISEKTFGQYRIEAEIGAGGMGIVYRAYDTKLQRTVAIKFLSAEFDVCEAGRSVDEGGEIEEREQVEAGQSR